MSKELELDLNTLPRLPDQASCLKLDDEHSAAKILPVGILHLTKANAFWNRSFIKEEMVTLIPRDMGQYAGMSFDKAYFENAIRTNWNKVKDETITSAINLAVSTKC